MIQARGADGLTIYYFWSEGSGTQLDPFKSKQLAVQSGEWDVSVNNLPDVFPVSFNWQGLTDTELRAAPLAVTGDFYQDVQPVTIAGGSNITVEVGRAIEATQSGTWNISNVIGTISLPTGAATENTLTTIDSKLPSNLTVVGDRLQVDADVALPQVFSIDGSVSVDNFPTGLATDTTLTALSNKVPTGLAVVGDRLKVDANVTLPSTYEVTGAVEITNAAVPVVGSVTVDNQLTGLATEAKQDALIAKLPAGLTVENSRLKVDANVNLPSSYPVTGTVGISNFPAVQEVSGSVTADTGLIQPLTNTELRASPLEVDIDVSLLATEQTLSSLSSKVPQLTLAGDRLKVDANINAQTDIAVNNYAALVTALEAATLQAEVVNNVSVITDQLIDTTGLATSANQTTANSTLSTINTKLPSNLTVTSTRLLVDGSGVTQPVSLATLPAGSNTIGSIANTTFASTQSGTWNINNITGTVSLPTGAATAANQTSSNASLSSIDVKLPSNLTVASTRLLVDGSGVTQPISGTVTANTGLAQPLTDTQLRAANVGVTVSNFPATQVVSGTVTANTGLTQPLTQAQLLAQNIGVAVSNFPSAIDPTQYINVRQTDGDQFSTPRLTKFSESLTAHNISVLNYKPTWGASDLRYRKTITGTGASIGESAGELVLQTGTTTTGTASLETLQRGQYQAGQQGQFGMGVRLSSLPTGSQFAEWGYFDEQNGFGFGIDATSLYTFSLFNGVKTKVYRANWSKDKLDGTGTSGLTLDITQGIVCHVDFIWYGYGDIDYGFLVYNPDTQHTQYIIANDLKVNGSVSTCDPNQPLRMVVNNGGSTASNFILCVGGHQFSVIGGETQPKRRHLGEFINDYQLANNTNWQPVLAIRRKSVFGDSGRVNSVKCFLRSLSVSASGADIKWKLSQNGVTNNVTVPYATPTEWLAAETAVETKKTTATAITTIASGYPILYLSTAAGENVERIFEFDLDLTIDSTNEWVLYAQRTTGTATIRSAAIHWVEEW